MHLSTLSPVWIGTLIAAANLAVTIGGIGFAWGTLSGRLKTIEAAQDAIWSEIMSIKKALGLADGAPSRFVERIEMESLRQRVDEDRIRTNAHSDRLRTLEVQMGGKHES